MYQIFVGVDASDAKNVNDIRIFSDVGLEGRHNPCEHAAAVQIPSPSGAADVPPANTFLVVDVNHHKEDTVLRHHQQAAGALAAAHGI